MARNNTIFFVEDDRNLGIVIKDFLESEGYRVIHYVDGDAAWQGIDDNDFSIAVLDIMLPGRDGLELARKIKEKKPGKPVVFLTAKSMPEDRLAGLEMGADDYITKPFLTKELHLRIQKILANRPEEERVRSRKHLRIGHFRFYPEKGLLIFKDRETTLSATESALLELLWKNRNEMVTRENAFARVWQNKLDPGSRILDVYVGRLRKILADDPRLVIRSVHGRGYRMELHS